MLKTLRLQTPLTSSHFFTETGAPTALRAWQLPFRRRYRPFQTSVSRHMFFQCTFRRRCMLTHVTYIRLMPCVCTEVYDKLRVKAKFFTAFQTREHHARFTLTHQTPITLALFFQIHESTGSDIRSVT